MSSLDVQPYPLPRADLIRADDWRWRRRGVLEPLPEVLPAWDYAMQLELARSVDVGVEQVLRDCGLGSGTRLAVVVQWRATSTRLSGIAVRHLLDSSRHDTAAELHVSLTSQVLGGTLVLETQLVLLGAGSPSGPLSPKRTGSILWRDRIDVRLEGEGPRFPVEMVDFQGTGIAPGGAGWYLDWTPESLQDATLSSFVLYLNSNHPVISRVAADPFLDAEARAVMAAIEFDVARQLTERALDSDDLVMAKGTYPAGTLGSMLQRLISLYWPGTSVESLRALRRDRPAEFSARLQARLRTFGPPQF